MTVHAGLDLRCQNADINFVGGVSARVLGENGLNVLCVTAELWLLESAVEGGAVRDQHAEVALAKPCGKHDGDAHIAFGLLPGAQGGFH